MEKTISMKNMVVKSSAAPRCAEQDSRKESNEGPDDIVT